jgi:Tfp pilus assembly PilM family ATPase
LSRAIEARARVPVAIMEPFKSAAKAPHLDEAFLQAHGAQGLISLGLALRSPGDKFE